MKRLNIKKLIIILLVIAIGFVVFLFTKTKKTNTEIIERFQQNLNVPNYFQENPLPIENNIKKSDFDFPPTLPYLKQTNSGTLDTSYVNQISSNLGFDNEPLTYNDIKNGKVLIWNGEEYSLTIIPQRGSVQMVSNISIRNLVQNSGNIVMNENEIKNIATELISSNFDLSSNDVQFAGFTYFKVQNGIENLAKTNKDDSQIIQINYSEGNFKYPILTADPDKSQITVQFLKNGHIINLSANLGFNFQESPSQYPLKTFDQFSDQITSSVLISLDNNNVNLPDLKNSDINNLIIEKVSLAYLLDFSNQNIVQPVFLIEGQALIKSVKGPVNASLYLPAFEGFK